MAAAVVIILAAAGITVFVGRNAVSTVSSGKDSTATTVKKRYGNTKHARRSYNYSVAEDKAELFYFDPNTADSTDLLRLGLQPWQVRNIYKYRARGGIYRDPSDFARLYGLTTKRFKELEPYIRIPDDYRPAAEVYAKEHERASVRDTTQFPVKLGHGEQIALNTADTALLKRVPGIGSGFARAITAYRERLGGFYCVEQLTEIGGFPHESLQYFKPDGAPLRRLDINKATLSQLRKHPYISFYQAKSILDHRRTRGKITSLESLKMYKDFTPEDIERLRHYVNF